MNEETTEEGPLSLVDAVRLRDHAQEANKAVQMARVLLNSRTPTDGMGKTPDDFLFEAQELTQRSASMLYRLAGPSKPSSGDLSLSALARLDTPDTRALLALLEQAQEVAERVDAERGHALPADLPLQPGESRGTDLAEIISEIALRVRGEVHGRGVGRE